MKNIVAVVGDYYHLEEDSAESLNRALQPLAESASVSLRFVSAGRLAEALATGPDAVILFKENRVAPNEDEHARWMTRDIADAIVRYVEGGGGWLAWHSGLASYDSNGAYVSMLKGHFLYHPAEHRPVRYDREAGESFEFLDEHYFVECRAEETEVFLRSESEDGASIAGWRHAHGRGRVCCLTPAHRREGLLHPELLVELRRALVWCCGQG